jgi:hypothetical protein
MWLAGIDGAVAPLALVVSDYGDRVIMVCAAKEIHSIQLNKEIRSIPQKVFRNLFFCTGVGLCSAYRFR